VPSKGERCAVPAEGKAGKERQGIVSFIVGIRARLTMRVCAWLVLGPFVWRCCLRPSCLRVVSEIAFRQERMFPKLSMLRPHAPSAHRAPVHSHSQNPYPPPQPHTILARSLGQRTHRKQPPAMTMLLHSHCARISGAMRCAMRSTGPAGVRNGRR
jgi:hypothetical protein